MNIYTQITYVYVRNKILIEKKKNQFDCNVI